jgi:hypothetical protein
MSPHKWGSDVMPLPKSERSIVNHEGDGRLARATPTCEVMYKL